MPAEKEKDKKQRVLSGRQKVAIFLVSLGMETSSEIFKHLREEEIEQITFDIARLENIEAADKDAVFREFQEMMIAQDFITQGGIDYARDLLERSVGSQKASDIINRLTSSLQVRPFDFIRRTDPAHLLNFIQGEHPQTIALILAYLEAQKAASILGALPTEIQPDVAKRIAIMDRTSPEVLREVERVLERKLSTLASEDFTSAGGIDSIVEIIMMTELYRRYFVRLIQATWLKHLRVLIQMLRIKFIETCPNVLLHCLKRIWTLWDLFVLKMLKKLSKKSLISYVNLKNKVISLLLVLVKTKWLFDVNYICFDY